MEIENLQNQHRPIKRSAVGQPFDILDLRRGEFIVENHELDLVCLGKLLQFSQLALSEVGGSRWHPPLLGEHTHHLKTRCFGKTLELIETGLLRRLPYALLKKSCQDDPGVLPGFCEVFFSYSCL